MNHVKLLDCTLRDGAYLVDKQFGDENIKGIIRGLVNTQIEYIEIGFFQNEGFGDGKTVYLNSEDASRFIPKDKRGCEFAVLADYSRYNIDNLDMKSDNSIDIVRECFFKHERFDALEVCKVIKQKGYKLFVQPVDILGYTDIELIEFINMVNEIEPYCLSIVDTFGSMYQEDLVRVYELVNHNLIKSCKIGFHSHNNMQMSNALSQEFIRMTFGQREIVVDGTLSGMGRGAGNTPIELIVQYLSSRWGYNYNIDEMLDLIDTYIGNIKSRCEWGYTTTGLIAGSYGAHMNNISYLTKRTGIKSKDIRYILNRIGAVNRKRYDYKLLEETYMNYLHSDVDDRQAIDYLRKVLNKKNILLLVPGNSLMENKEIIYQYIQAEKPIVISVNFVNSMFEVDYVYMSNVKRYQFWKNNEIFTQAQKIITSNILCEDENAITVSFVDLIKCGWENMDNSTLMLLRLIDKLDVEKISIAGFDGYDFNQDGKVNYFQRDMEIYVDAKKKIEVNREIDEMLKDFIATRRHKDAPIDFVTESRFSYITEENR